MAAVWLDVGSPDGGIGVLAPTQPAQEPDVAYVRTQSGQEEPGTFKSPAAS